MASKQQIVLRGLDLSGLDFQKADLSGADLSGANLSGANLSGANLSGADLSNAILRRVDLSGADLSNAILSGADLSHADFGDANLCDADLSGANLCDADLSGANLSHTCFQHAQLISAFLNNAKIHRTSFVGADLCFSRCDGIDLRTAELRLTHFYGARMHGVTVGDVFSHEVLSGLHPVFPTVGAFTAFKKLAGNKIAMLEVPASAQRSSATTRKGRVSEALVAAIWGPDNTPCLKGVALYNDRFAYVVGTTVVPDAFDSDRWNECSSGIHCFLTREEAERW